MFKILNNSKIVTVLFVAVSVITSGQQIIHDNIITLEVLDSGNKVYIGEERVEFLPGYSFDAFGGNRMSAFIGPYGNLYSSSDFNNHQLDANLEVGSLQGVHQVTESGGFAYTVPIDLPNGANGMTPQLSLNYNSQAGNGILGMGWNLQGLSMISRVVKPTYFQDESIGFDYRGPTSINTNYQDAFALDGQLLIGIDGDYGFPNSVYATEVENYNRIISHGTQGSGPEWFEVISKEGMIIKYGLSSHSKVNGFDGTAMIWLVERIEDQNGNYIIYEYDNNGDEVLLSSIKYTGNINNGTNPLFEVKFDYTLRKDPFDFFIDHRKVVNKHIISSIKILKENNKIYEYELKYGYNLYSLLSQISKKVNGLEKHNPLIFKYGDEVENQFYSSELKGTVPFLNDQISNGIIQRFDNKYYHHSGSADFSGNGLTDMYRFSTSRGPDDIYFGSTGSSILSIFLNKGEGEFEYAKSLELPTNAIVHGANRDRNGNYSYDNHIRGRLNTSPNSIDFDGDGKQDLIYFQLVNSLNYDETEEEYDPASNWLVKMGYLRSEINNGEFDFNLIESGLLTAGESGLPHFNIWDVNKFYFQGDFTGNGITDIIITGCNSSKNSFGITIIPGNPQRSNQLTVNSGSVFEFQGDDAEFVTKADYIYVVDFNGDGKSDLMAVNGSITKIFTFELTDELTPPFFQLEGSIIELYSSGFPTKWHDIKLGDFNGDGKTDILTIDENQNNFSVHYSTGRWFLSEDFDLQAELLDPNYWKGKDEFIIFDANGDGKSDLVHLTYGINASNTGFLSYQQLYISNGSDFSVLERDLNFYNGSFNGISARVENKSNLALLFLDDVQYSVVPQSLNMLPVSSLPNETHIYDNTNLSLVSSIGDFNGDGSQDLAVSFSLYVTPYTPPGYEGNNINNIDITIEYAFQDTYSLFEYNPNSNYLLLESVKNGLNITHEVGYSKFSSDDYIETSDLLAYPLVEFVPRIPIVNNVVIKDSPLNILSEISFNYKNPVIHQRGKGFLGFTEVENTDHITQLKSSSFYRIFEENTQPTLVYDWDQNHFSLYMDYTELYSELTDEVISKSIFEFEFEDLSNRRRLQFPLKETNENYIDEITQEVTYSYNHQSGNLEEKYTLLNGGEYEEIETYQYAEIASLLNLDNKLVKIDLEQVRFGEIPFISESTFDYHPVTGNLIEKKSQINTPYEITEEFSHDVFGNVVKIISKASGFVDKVSETIFDLNGRLPIKTINELGQEASIQYHPIFDKPIKIIDVDGLTSTSTYNIFGDIAGTIDKYGITSTIQKEWVNTNPTTTTGNYTQADDIMYKVTELRQGEPNKTIHYNRLGQERMTEIQGLNDPVFSVTTYNNKGQIVSTTEPFFQGSPNIAFNLTAYDDYNRVTSVTQNGETVSYSYQIENGLRKMTTVNPDGVIFTSFEDASGNTIKSEDNGGIIEYTYFSHGRVKEIKVNNEIVATSEYDVLGRQNQLMDVNAGSIQYLHNAFGDITQTINANGEVKFFEYDDFGRLLQTNLNGIIVDYEYVGTGNGINNIEKISTQNHEQFFEYDGLNRVIKTTEIINGNYFQFEYVYNNLNQIKQIIYPNEFIVNNIYDNRGYLVEVQDYNNNILWQGEELDPFGRYVKFTKGDGVTTELFFDAFQNLEEINAGNVHHHIYNWDSETGNLSYRQDINKQIEEVFQYDNINRLTNSTVGDMNIGLVLGGLEMNYAPNGNLIDKTDAGIYTYHPIKTNAVTDVTNEYQNIKWQTQDIGYNALNKASTISEGDFTLQFLYGYDKQRRMTSLYDQNGLAMEKYFVGLYEKEIEGNITRHINYIIAGDGMTAIVLEEEENGNTEIDTYFTYKDHLGSIVALSDVNGDVVLEQSFDAWGRYRNPNDWTYNNINESPTWLRGYTGHEHLPHFDLINMNGRIYDPILGRMLSPDRFVSDPLSTQSYNRYAYVLNNPLRYSDPSGDFPVAAAIIGTVAGAYIGGSIMNNSFSISEWSMEGDDKWKTLAGIGVGAVSGFFGGWGVGSKIASKTISAKQLGGNTLAGVINARYNYEEGQGVLTSMGYFSAGFLGSQMGIEGGVLYGLHGGGIMTAIVGATHMPDEYQGYYLAQKYVGGALSSYSGMTFTNSKLGYLKHKGAYFGGSKKSAKAASYAIQNIAQRFAYTDRKYYVKEGLGRGFLQNIVMPGLIGSLAGAAHYNVNNIETGDLFKGSGDFGKFFNKLEAGGRLAKFGVGLSVYGLDYAANTFMVSGYNPFDYDGFSRTASMGSTKSLFYYLILE